VPSQQQQQAQPQLYATPARPGGGAPTATPSRLSTPSALMVALQSGAPFDAPAAPTSSAGLSSGGVGGGGGGGERYQEASTAQEGAKAKSLWGMLF
jgi:hypothetical protein